MKNISLLVIAAALSLLYMTSCVSGKKFRELQTTNRQNLMDLDDCKAKSMTLELKTQEQETKVAAYEKEISQMKQDLAQAQIDKNRTIDDLASLNSRYAELQNAQEDLIKGNMTETKKLLADLKAAQETLKQKEDVLRQLEQSVDMKKIALDELNTELEKKNTRMAELEKVLDSQKKIVSDLKNKVSEALMGFENNGLTVTNRNGKVYVSLEEKLLFKTARWDIDANGRTALRKLAVVLEKNPDIQVTIEGHTDNVPYTPGSGQLKDNWDLSVKRATTVVRVLLEGSKIKPSRLTAAGRSEYQPIDTNNTPESRQKNRRTEIILTPDLSELYKIIDRE
jgi:chemotaxis protein MotB